MNIEINHEAVAWLETNFDQRMQTSSAHGPWPEGGGVMFTIKDDIAEYEGWDW
ncbi:hypothetical protein OHA25_04880 [Nonomuraea sp. NBC_00507]|uniref:hypothetical protein n=1 Tax=Nonomuraea sp. NBC_00507 TaxID=2976002 RepID=UPI002E192188